MKRVRQALVGLGLVGGAVLLWPPLVGSNVLEFSLEEVAMLEKVWIIDVKKVATRLIRKRNKANAAVVIPRDRTKESKVRSTTTQNTATSRPTSKILEAWRDIPLPAGLVVNQQPQQSLENKEAWMWMKPKPKETKSKSDADLYWLSVGGVMMTVMYLLSLTIFYTIKKSNSLDDDDEEEGWLTKKRSQSVKKLRNGYHFKGKMLGSNAALSVEIEDGPPVVSDEYEEAYQQQAQQAINTHNNNRDNNEEAKEEKGREIERGVSEGTVAMNGNDHVDSQEDRDEQQNHQQHQQESESSTAQGTTAAKRVRFSAWQTEDDGEGSIKREPFAAYEFDGYDDSSSEGSYSSGSGSDGDNSSDDESGSEEEEAHAQ